MEIGYEWLWRSFFAFTTVPQKQKTKPDCRDHAAELGLRTSSPRWPGRPAGRGTAGPLLTERANTGGWNGEKRRSVQAAVPSQPIGWTEKQDIVTC